MSEQRSEQCIPDKRTVGIGAGVMKAAQSAWRVASGCPAALPVTALRLVSGFQRLLGEELHDDEYLGSKLCKGYSTEFCLETEGSFLRRGESFYR